MQKRGISNVVLTVILVLLSVVAIVFSWAAFSLLIKEQREIAEAKSKLFLEKFRIKNFSLNLQDKNAAVLIEKEGGLISLEGLTIAKEADIVLIIDSSENDTLTVYKNMVLNNTEGGLFSKLKGEGLDYRIALIEFKDYNVSPCGDNDDFPSKVFNFDGDFFTKNESLVLSVINNITPKIAGDFPQASLTAIQTSYNLTFRENAQKIILLLASSPPHARDCLVTNGSFSYEGGSTYNSNCYGDQPHPKNISDVVEELKKENIKLYYINFPLGVCTKNKKDLELATNTGGQYYDFTFYRENRTIEDLIKAIAKHILGKFEGVVEIKYLNLVITNDRGRTHVQNIYNFPINPYETKKIKITNLSIENPRKVELYAVILTSSGREVTSPKLAEWEIK